MKNSSSEELRRSIEAAHSQGRRSIAYLPLGCMEQHGPFLPLETDSLIAESASASLTYKNPEKYHGYVFPVIHYTPSQSNVNFCGTASVSDNSFRIYAKEVCAAIMRSPFDALVIIAGHAGVEASMKEIGFWLVNEQFTTAEGRVRPVLVESLFDLSPALEARFGQRAGRHADWREFLMIRHILGAQYFTQEKIQELSDFSAKNTFPVHSSRIYGVPMEYRSTQGVVGEPLPNSRNDWAEMSSEFWAFVIDNLAARIFSQLENFWNNNFAGH